MPNGQFNKEMAFKRISCGEPATSQYATQPEVIRAKSFSIVEIIKPSPNPVLKPVSRNFRGATNFFVSTHGKRFSLRRSTRRSSQRTKTQPALFNDVVKYSCEKGHVAIGSAAFEMTCDHSGDLVAGAAGNTKCTPVSRELVTSSIHKSLRSEKNMGSQ